MWNIYSFYQFASKFLSFKIKLVIHYEILFVENFLGKFWKKNPWNLLELFGMDRIKNLMKKWSDETSI